MAKKKLKDLKEDHIHISLFNKVIAIPTIIIFFTLWFIDRFMHLILFHATHPKLTEWIKTEGSVKHTITRIIIFSIPVILYKIFI